MMIDNSLFKDVLSHFATGIVIATILNDDGKPFGLTINAFSSLSLDPPLVLFCLAKTTRFYSYLQLQENFTINILADDQEEFSKHFAKPFQGDIWKNISFHIGKNNCPKLDNVLAWIECSKWASYEGGDHDIIVGHVNNLGFFENKEPLLYYKRKYAYLMMDEFEF